MSISIFTINRALSSFYNLDNAIHAAKDMVKNAVLDCVMAQKESRKRWDPENKTYSNENLRKCVLKYSVTQDAPNEVRVRAKLAIPVKCANDSRKHEYFSRSVVISASQMDYQTMRNTEEVFAELGDENDD